MTHLDSRALDRAFAVAARQVEDGHAPWAVLGVATRDAVVRLDAYGARPDGSRIGANAVALIASITKPIVATMVLQLVAEGRLALDEPLERLLPEAAAAAEAAGTGGAAGTSVAPSITAWHLLTHTSGLADLDLPDLLSRDTTHADVERRLLREPRRSDPGTTFAYATATFDLLAALVTRHDGRPYPDALRARVLEPLGMTDTTFDPRQALRERMVLPISAPLPDGGPVPDDDVDAFITLAMPGAGLWSTAADLLRFGRAFARGGELDGARVLPRTFVERMTREVTVHGLGAAADPLAAEHYALGWGIPGPADPGSPGAFFHGGITGTRLWVDPGEDLVITYMTGAWEQPAWPADAVLNAVYAALA